MAVNPLSFFIARRYFFSKKSQRVINIISMISVIGVTIGTAALVIVLSVFNGFEDVILRLYNSFDPDIRITVTDGKTFSIRDIDPDSLRALPEIRAVTEVIEEKALVEYNDKQFIVTLKGVGSDYRMMTGLDTMIIDGELLLERGDTNYAVVGGAIAYNLRLNLNDIFSQLEVYAPRRTASSLAHPEESFNRRYISASSVFAVQQEFDTRYIIVPLRFARDIFEYEDELTGIEIGLKEDADITLMKTRLREKLGPAYVVKDRLEQHDFIYKIMRSEKWAVFLILTFILIIATFNVISSLTMLVIEKKKDISVYRSLGADISLVRAIFITEGMFITLAGALLGIVIGTAICTLQQEFGLVKLSGSGSFVIDAYPVKMQIMDFVYVFLTVCGIGFLASWYPSLKLIRERINLRLISDE
jgi:lipoprotein-releasing system permease protein